jgi:hypothetical protein
MKQTKVVYNPSYGGFCLPMELFDKYYCFVERHNSDLIKSVEKDPEGTGLSIKTVNENKYYIDEYDSAETVLTPQTIHWTYISSTETAKINQSISSILEMENEFDIPADSIFSIELQTPFETKEQFILKTKEGIRYVDLLKLIAVKYKTYLNKENFNLDPIIKDMTINYKKKTITVKLDKNAK